MHVRYGHFGVTCKDKEGRWLDWGADTRKWYTSFDEAFIDGNRYVYSNAPCRTFKAFRRHVRKHSNEVPEGSVFTFVSGWCGIPDQHRKAKHYNGPVEVCRSGFQMGGENDGHS